MRFPAFLQIHLRQATALLLAAALFGCATDDDYELTPPKDDEAKACAARCSDQRSDCRGQEDEQASLGYRGCLDRAEAAQQKCEVEAEASYNQCLKTAQGKPKKETRKKADPKKAKKPKTEKERKALEKKEKAEREKLEKERARIEKAMAACERRECPATIQCFDDPVYAMCDSDFRVCYQDCGGQVEYKRK